VGFKVFESIFFETSIATVTLWLTVNKLLLRKLEELSCLDEMISFNCGS